MSTEAPRTNLPITGLGPHTLQEDIVTTDFAGRVDALEDTVVVLDPFLTNEVQTLDFGDIGATNTFTLTLGDGDATDVVTYSADMTDDITEALYDTYGFTVDDVTVEKVSTSVYTVQFSGAYASSAQEALDITDPTTFTPVGVTITVRGGQPPIDTTAFETQGSLEDTADLQAVLVALEARLAVLE